MNESHRFIDLLEFLYFCMVLGFEGKYHVMHNGGAKLDQLIETVYKQLEKHRGEPPAQLLTPATNIYDARQKLPWHLPLWAIATLGVAALTVIHIAFDMSLTGRIEGIGAQIGSALSVASDAPEEGGQ